MGLLGSAWQPRVLPGSARMPQPGTVGGASPTPQPGFGGGRPMRLPWGILRPLRRLYITVHAVLDLFSIFELTIQVNYGPIGSIENICFP
jgi:hypothetical protein